MHYDICSNPCCMIDVLLHSTGIIHSVSQVYTEKVNIILELSLLRPYGLYFCLMPSLKQADIPPIPWSIAGFDYIMTSSKYSISPNICSGAPPTQQSALASDPGGTGSMICRASEHRTRNIPPQTDGMRRQDMMANRSHQTLDIVIIVIFKQEINGGYHCISC